MVSNDRPVGQDRSIDRCRLVDQGIYRIINQSILTDRPIIQYHGRSIGWSRSVGQSVKIDQSVGDEDRSVGLDRSVINRSRRSLIDPYKYVRLFSRLVNQD